MKSNKGFTLVELLAVIVILAIVALVATPVILNIVTDSRNSAKESEAKLIVNSVEMAYSVAQMSPTNNGSTPKVSDVSTQFGKIVDNATWSNDKITASGTSTECDVVKTKDENVTKSFKVTCTVNSKTYETKSMDVSGD